VMRCHHDFREKKGAFPSSRQSVASSRSQQLQIIVRYQRLIVFISGNFGLVHLVGTGDSVGPAALARVAFATVSSKANFRRGWP
jgi:hypothetical protein